MKQKNISIFTLTATNQKLANQASAILRKKGYTIGIAESCTGGLLSYHFISMDNASSIINGAMITYSNEMKASWLNVDDKDLQMYGAVSESVVRAMCAGILLQTNSDVALATSGIAGPGGGSEETPVGCVYIGVQLKGNDTLVRRCHFNGSRHDIQRKSCAMALKMLITLFEP